MLKQLSFVVSMRPTGDEKDLHQCGRRIVANQLRTSLSLSRIDLRALQFV
jgi:hypothetical protein